MGLTIGLLCDWIPGLPRSSGYLRKDSLLFVSTLPTSVEVEDEDPFMFAACNQEGCH